jgi:ABC-type polysaccharide/polyol phosphate transport system ATPase subunit
MLSEKASMIDLKFDNISKKYRVRQESPANGTKNALARKVKSLFGRSSDFWAVRDVSFEVQRGQALGIIGHNGAGKSTILKLLANITTPTSGEITIFGRLSALIEVGSGFHQELTGRENVYLNGSILGMRRREISKKIDSIFDFAGVRQFIDTPVKRYSSGMYVRLGFSIAAHLDPDILLLDEVLAVGDAAFQAKCIRRITELKESGTTIVFISHDLGAVEALCDRVLLMERGQLIADGTAREVINEYEASAGRVVLSAPPAELENSPSRKDAEIVSVITSGQNRSQTVHTAEKFTAVVECEVNEHVADAVFELFFYAQDGSLCCQFTTEYGLESIELNPGQTALEFSCEELPLLPGLYHLDATIKHRNAAGGDDIDWKYRCAMLRVDTGKIVRGEFYAQHEWRLLKHKSSIAFTSEQGDGESVQVLREVNKAN